MKKEIKEKIKDDYFQAVFEKCSVKFKNRNPNIEFDMDNFAGEMRRRERIIGEVIEARYYAVDWIKTISNTIERLSQSKKEYYTDKELTHFLRMIEFLSEILSHQERLEDIWNETYDLSQIADEDLEIEINEEIKNLNKN
ncbi:MAG: hypothetical protein LBP67_01770 [Bacteroidales bacterium]|jgi:hypothetical protein|nr:hypothetical protein [Bacteroidales bacterium]